MPKLRYRHFATISVMSSACSPRLNCCTLPRILSIILAAACCRFWEWAAHSITHSVWARSYYQQLRRRGKQHRAAVRALAFKWIRIVFRCWKDGVAYDESKYLATLARRGSFGSNVAQS